MTTPSDKPRRPYAPPELFRIDLHHEQAVLSACSTTATSVFQGAQGGCKFGGATCRKHPSTDFPGTINRGPRS